MKPKRNKISTTCNAQMHLNTPLMIKYLSYTHLAFFLRFCRRLQGAWQSKAPYLYVLPYCFAFQHAPSDFLWVYVGSIITLIGSMATAYWVHDWIDTNEDAATPHPWQRIPNLRKLLGLLLLITIAALPWTWLPTNQYSYWMMGAQAAALLLYNAPPFMLKYRGWAGVICDACYAYVIPSSLAAYTFMLALGENRLWDIILWATLSLFVGTRHYLNHLCLNFVADKQANKQTLVHYYSIHRIRNTWMHALVATEAILFGLWGYQLTQHLGIAYDIGYDVGISAAISTTVTIVLLYGLGAFTRTLLHVYSFLKTPIDAYYAHALPIALILINALQQPQYFILLTLHAVLFTNYIPKIYRLLFPLLSKIANYAAYYLKLYLLQQSPQRALGLHYDSFRRYQRTEEKVQAHFAIGVVNKNQNKYTETYIQHTLGKFSFGVYYLWGEKGAAKLPYCWGDGRQLKSNAWKKYHKTDAHKACLCSFLLQKNIKVLLVHFGTTAAHIIDVAQSMGLPMIVYFHGYDAHHKPTWEAYSRQYQALFKYAYAFICASQGIANKLQHAGAPVERLHVLPAYVHVEACQYTDHSTQPANLLFVGRFCEVKSPHVLLVAFSRVLAQLPDAKLTLIGEGSLYESCMILSRALGFTTQVRFLGACDHATTLSHMHQARALVLPSLSAPLSEDKEGTPVAVLEACAMGLPVIATRHEGIAEVITHEVQGLLVEEYDIPQLAAAMIRICRDDALAQRIGKDAHAHIMQDTRITQHITYMENMVSNARKLYESMNPAEAFVS